MKNPIISICIPTYNRPHSLDRMLETLIPQLKESKVEVLIYDDSPNDDSKKIVHKKFKNLEFKYKYIEGNKEGLDKAVMNMVKIAEGEYIWMFGDDDGFCDNAISNILEVTKKQPDFVWVNYVHGKKREVAVDSPIDGFLDNGDQLLDLVGMNIGFFPTLIIRKEKLTQNINLVDKISRPAWFFLPVILQVISGKDNKIYFVKDPQVIHYYVPLSEVKKKTERRGGEKTGSSLKVFGVYVYEIFMFFRNRFKRKTIRNLLKKNFRFLWKGMVVNKIRGWYKPTKKDILTMIKYYWSYPDCWIAVILLLLPRWLDKALYKVFKLFK